MAELDLKLPNLRQGASAEENISELYAYLKKQNEKLKYILNNLDVDSFNEDVKLQLATAVKLTETNTQVIDTQAKLEELISKTADTIIKDIQQETTDLQGQIREISEVLGAERTSDLNTEIIQSALGMALKTEVTSIITNLLGTDETAYGEPSKYQGYIELGFDEGERGTAVKIGGKDGTNDVMETVITPDNIEFRQGDMQLAYFGIEDMFIRTVRTLALRFGRAEEPRSFYFTCGTDENTGVTTLALKYDALFDETYYNNQVVSGA